MKDRLDRRNFLKAGLGTGGAIAAGEMLPSSAFSASIDDQPSSSRPPWAEEVDQPVLAIDDNSYRCFDQHDNVLNAYRRYVSEEQARQVERKKQAFLAACEQDDIPGYRREDRALMSAGWTLRGTGNMNKGLRKWTGNSRRRSPVEKWEADPQKAAHVVKKAARFFGSADTGIALVDRRHIYSRSYGVDVVFEDVEQPYDVEGEKAVIPEKCKYAIALVVRMSPEAASRAPSQLCDATTSLGYSRLEFTVGTLAEFIRNLGYVAIPSVNGMGSSIPFAVDAGLGELGRTNRFISPRYGPAVQLGMNVPIPAEFEPATS